MRTLALALLAPLALTACDNLPVDGRPGVDPTEELGDPIVAAAHVWRWIDFPDTKCADGSPTGLGINLSPGADKAFIYLEGGGACWSYENCFAVPTAFHLDGFDRRDFEGLLTDTYLHSTLFDREDARNPLRDAHLVFVPYCTADAFMGDRIARFQGGLFGLDERDMHFAGAANIRAYLRRLVPTFADVDHVVLAGSSAGGFGAAFNWWAVKDFFPDARVDVIDDSGPPIDPVGGNWGIWQETWGVALPDGCVDCDQRVGAVMEHARRTLTDQGRFALLSYRRDTIISAFFGLFPHEFEQRLMRYVDAVDADPNVQSFVLPGPLHTFMVIGFDAIEADNGLPLWRWIEQMIDGDPDWRTVRR